MAYSKTTYVVAGEAGPLAKVSVYGIDDVSKAGTLRTALANLSDGAFQKQSFSSRSVIDIEPTAGSSTNIRGIAYFQEVASGTITRVTIPAIKAAHYETVPGRTGGKRIKDASMDTIKAALEAATGESLVVLYGKVIEKQIHV